MSKLTRSVTAGAGVIAACALIAIGAGAVGAAPQGRATSGTVYAAITHSVGSTEYAAGDTTDKVLGKGAVTFTLSASSGTKPGTVSLAGGVTVFTTTGSISGTDSVTLTVSSSGAVTFSNGKLNLNKGTGGQKGHTFVGTVTGSGKSINGPFVFHEKGTYK